MYEVDAVGLLGREVLLERTPELVAEVCAWSVGLSDQPYCVRRRGTVVPSGSTLGARALAELPLADEDGRLDLGDARPGSLQDVLAALTPTGRLWADVLDEQVLEPFVLTTCVRAAERVRERDPRQWAELLDELGEDGDDLEEVVRAAEWEAPLRTVAEQAVLAALAAVPLVEVEAEGLPLSVVRRMEAETRRAAPVVAAEPAPSEEDLAGALFLAEAAVRAAGLDVPVPPGQADRLLEALQDEGLEPHEVLAVLGSLPVRAETAEEVADTVRALLRERG